MYVSAVNLFIRTHRVLSVKLHLKAEEFWEKVIPYIIWSATKLSSSSLCKRIELSFLFLYRNCILISLFVSIVLPSILPLLSTASPWSSRFFCLTSYKHVLTSLIVFRIRSFLLVSFSITSFHVGEISYVLC